MRSVTVAGQAARLRGLALATSKKLRLERIAPGSKVSSQEVLVPLRVPDADTAATLVALLEELLPPPVFSGPVEGQAPPGTESGGKVGSPAP